MLDLEEDEDTKVLDGFFLMKHCCVDDPSDLCSVNISGQCFTDVKEEDFALFDNVAYVNAAENFLPLEAFNFFPIIRELEMPLNAVMGISVKLGEFMNLELLDLSYNNLMPNDLLPLGLMPKLRVLHLTGNGLHTLPPELSRPHVEELKQGNRKINRFPSLEILLLDDNRLSDLTSFAALAGLRNLKHLNMSKNEIRSVPQLMLVEGRHITQEFDTTSLKGRPKSRKSARRSGHSKSSRISSSRKVQTGSKINEKVKGETGNEVRAPSNISQSSFTANAAVVTQKQNSDIKDNEVNVTEINDTVIKTIKPDKIVDTATPATESQPPIVIPIAPQMSAGTLSSKEEELARYIKPAVEVQIDSAKSEEQIASTQRTESLSGEKKTGIDKDLSCVGDKTINVFNNLKQGSADGVIKEQPEADDKMGDSETKPEADDNKSDSEAKPEANNKEGDSETKPEADDKKSDSEAKPEADDNKGDNDIKPETEKDNTNGNKVEVEADDVTPVDETEATNIQTENVDIQEEQINADTTSEISGERNQTSNNNVLSEDDNQKESQQQPEATTNQNTAASTDNTNKLEQELPSSEIPKDDMLQMSSSLSDLNLDGCDLDAIIEGLDLEKSQQDLVATLEEEGEYEINSDELRKREIADRLSRMSGYQAFDGDLPPPFPELRYLDLSHNLITEEEGLLAVAAWPALSELLIHNNPLTTQTTGDPPLLKRFLRDRLGIHLQRLAPGPLHKPHIEMHQKAERTIKTKIYPVPRIDVDALLAIEAAPPASAASKPTVVSEKTEPRSGISERTASTPIRMESFDATKPLPPIPRTPNYEDEEYEDSDEFDRESSTMRSGRQSDDFFMTAVDDQVEESTSRSTSQKRKVNRKKSKVRQKSDKELETLYRGFESLIDIDEDHIEEVIPLPKDISGNIRALQYALNHPLVFRENKVQLDRVQKPFKPYVRTGHSAPITKKPRSKTVEEVLASVKNRKTLEEESLSTVLKDKKRYRKHFSGADVLLEDDPFVSVQRKYNKVRASSMRDNNHLQEIMQSTIQTVQESSDSSRTMVS